MSKVSIVMPVYNQAEIVGESIQSALNQDYPDKEIIVIDDCSKDDTFLEVLNWPSVKAYRNDKNAGLGGNLNECIKKSSGEYIIILCGDDVFTHKSVVSDMVKVFENNRKVGVVGRYYYQYFDGIPGAVMTIRGDILTSSCQPSGVGFRRKAMAKEFTNELFIEIPAMVKSILARGWDYHIIKYDTIAARLHSGPKSNAATNPGYYKTTPQQSPTLNWHKVLGEPIGMYMGFIQIKNRAPFLLHSEIRETIKLNPKCLLNLGFWFCASIALIVPGWILRRLSNFYRHRITRRFVRVIERKECY
jgi:glycosyltransferase involved in cell wall biosynthesis